jgi:hypothetical protein
MNLLQITGTKEQGVTYKKHWRLQKMVKEKKSFAMADSRELVADWNQYEGLMFRNVMSIHYTGEPEGMAAKRAFFLGSNAQPRPVYQQVAALAEDEAKNSWI